jgi:hypothetical protein
MKKLITTTIAAVVCIGCQSTDSAQTQPVQPAETVGISEGAQAGIVEQLNSNRARIQKMLDTVRLKRFPITDVKSMPLQDIVDELYKALEYNETKIAFIIDNELLFSDVEQDVKVSIDPPLRNVTLGQALDKIVQTATVPMKYTVEEFGIIFSPKLGEAPKLVMRVYRFDSKKVLETLNKHSDIELHDFHQPESFKTLLDYFEAAGVDFYQTKPPQPGVLAIKQTQKALWFSEKLGLLYVKATEAEIDIADDIVKDLNAATTPQY